ncbi:hypothetical protein GGU10DRAFT_338273 [Lentinula aff. detonsa]|uniref:Uncharacterized protein n=1 Tax=Lentinula aff. detonsa TaxID=2804958 RepID=A0AA38NUC9_9AGAR|nr:hypothetical protein GGU10DRAFT_338273 [Lentinula aff. detonsa]
MFQGWVTGSSLHTYCLSLRTLLEDKSLTIDNDVHQHSPRARAECYYLRETVSPSRNLTIVFVCVSDIFRLACFHCIQSGSAQATPLPGDNTTFADCSQYLSGNQTSGAPPSSGNSTAGPQAKQAGATSVSVSPTTSSLNGASPSSVGDKSAAGSPPPANGTSIGTLSPTLTPTGAATVTRQARQESLSTTGIASLSTVSPSATNTPATEKSQNATAQAIDGNNSTSASANNTTSTASSSVETAA